MDERFVSESDWFWSDPDIDLSFSVGHHQCAVHHEVAGQLAKSGAVAVQQFCKCGRQVGALLDSVL